MSAPDIILKLSNIESYYGPIMAIRGISLEVPRGKIVTLLGANGAGKTTVLKTISGILDPQKGSIEFLGKPIQRMEADKIVRLGLSHVPEGREVFPFLSRAREPDDGRLSAQRSRRRRRRSGAGVRIFSAAAGTAQPAGRAALRRRAADARDRARADEPADIAACSTSPRSACRRSW